MKKRVLQILFFFFFLVIVYFLFWKNDKSVDAIEDLAPIVENNKDESKEIIIDIKGAVASPGVYTLPNGSRVKDAIEKSGGLREDADTNYLNLSKLLADETVIIIYTKDEIQSFIDGNVSIRYIDKECICPQIRNDGCISDNKITNRKEENQSTSLVNINTASKEELMTLSGIGDAKANLIIDYRKHTPFTKIEDIKNVKGIGESLFDKIKNNITV